MKVILSFLECLLCNKCFVAMISNYVSAIKACFVLYDLPFHILDHPKIKYFQKSLKINRPLTLTSHNIIDLACLERISVASHDFTCGQVLRAVFLTGFFSNLAPHSLAGFDTSRHLTGQDVFFTKKLVKVLIKWSKTIQTRDVVQVVSLPKLKNKLICPFQALKALESLYPMSVDQCAFQVKMQSGWQPIMDSKVRKSLKSIKMTLGLYPHFYTFHSFRRSGQPSPIMHISLFNRSSAMALGLPSVSGNIYRLTTLLVRALLSHMLLPSMHKCSYCWG